MLVEMNPTHLMLGTWWTITVPIVSCACRRHVWSAFGFTIVLADHGWEIMIPKRWKVLPCLVRVSLGFYARCTSLVLIFNKDRFQRNHYCIGCDTIPNWESSGGPLITRIHYLMRTRASESFARNRIRSLHGLGDSGVINLLVKPLKGLVLFLHINIDADDTQTTRGVHMALIWWLSLPITK